MARFNGSTAQQGGPPNARVDADADGAVWTPEQVARWHQEQALLQQQANSVVRAPGARLPSNGQAQAGYGQNYAAAHEPPAGSHHAHGGLAPPASYGSGLDGWRSQTGWSNAPPVDPHHGHLPQPHAADRFSAHPPPAPGYSDPSAARGYDPQFADFSARQPGHGRQDGQNWDLGAYPPAQHAPNGYGSGTGLPDPHGGQFAHPDAQHWAQHPGAASAHGQQHFGEPGFDPSGRGPHTGHQPSKFQFDPSEYGQSGHGHDFAEPQEDEEPRRRGTSAFVVAGALIGAIVLGGGLAYGYKQFTSAGPGNKAPDVVKADKSAPKAKPTNPGGKDVAHTDKKFLNQLAETSTADATPTEPDAGPRKVSTLVVGRDGSVTSPLPVNVSPAPPPSAGGVPGMVIDGGPRPMLRGASPSTEPSPSNASASDSEQRAVPRVSEMTLPRVRAEPQRPPVAEQPQPVTKAPAARKPAPARDDAAFSQAAAPAAVPPTAAPPRASSAGFVTVLASRKSREEAFSMYPDLQVKFADILSDKIPDVRETNLTAQGKGVVFRLVLGPPGSKEAAIETCNKLKAQGFTGCWATPY